MLMGRKKYKIQWEDEVKYLYLDKELGVPDTERFCQDVLKMRVVNKSTGAWTAVGDGTDRERLCTPESRVDTNHCVEAGRHTALGLAAMMLCVFVVFSELATEKVSAAHDVTVAAVTRFVPSASRSALCASPRLPVERAAPASLSALTAR